MLTPRQQRIGLYAIAVAGLTITFYGILPAADMTRSFDSLDSEQFGDYQVHVITGLIGMLMTGISVGGFFVIPNYKSSFKLTT